jgi:hypothetical protein
VSRARRVLIPILALTLSACHSSTTSAASHATPTSLRVTATGPSPSTTAGTQISGVRTVLSSVGLNIRAQASKSAAILGTAAQGATLTVLAHTDQGGGWFEVKGATHTGWISDNPTLSAAGKLVSYTSTEPPFGALYPEGWTVANLPPASVVFRSGSGSDAFVVTAAGSVTQLARGRGGYRQTDDEQLVVCGVTTDLVTYAQVSAQSTLPALPGGVSTEKYLVQVRLTLDAQHALGIDANLSNTSLLQTVHDFANSLTFPSPLCER